MVRSFVALTVIFLAVTSLVSATRKRTVCRNVKGKEDSCKRTVCRNDKGDEVSWFFIYKLPKGSTNEVNKEDDGTRYVYVDNTMDDTKKGDKADKMYWTLSDKKINDDKSALFNTIAPLTAEEKPKDFVYAVYNDQVEKQSYSGSGHTKGLFMFDGQTGVWIIHSVPNFPEKTNDGKYKYPETGKRFGQTVFCATFPRKELEKIAAHLRLQRPHIYEKTPASSSTSGALKLLLQEDFSETQKPGEKPEVLKGTLTDEAGNIYTSFAKPRESIMDVYSDELYSEVQSNLLVSTWRRGRKCIKVPSQRKHDVTVENVEGLTFHLDNQDLVNVKYTVDHSKWAISKEAKNHVCIGTLNRVTSQFKRGGETLCFENPLLHKLLKTTVTSLEPCTEEAEGCPRKQFRTEKIIEVKGNNYNEEEEEEENDEYYDGVDNCDDFDDLLENEE